MKPHIVAVLPIKTPSCANLREHWRSRAKRAKAHRQGAMFLCQTKVEKLGHPAMPETLVVLLTRVAPRPLDDDNLQSALKAIRDGVADALGVSDRNPRVEWKYGQRKGRVREHAVEIVFAW